MNENVKRVYSSELRATQARETRRIIVSSAATLFVEKGFGQTTVDAIAEEAGVSRKTVFAAVGGKVELLKLALDWAFAGDDEPIAMADRPEVGRLKQEHNPDALLRGYAHMLTTIGSRAAGLSRALTVAAGMDAEARRLWETSQSQRHSGARSVVGALDALGGLREGLEPAEAADIVWVHSDPALYHRLVIERRWAKKRYEEWLYETLRRQLRP
jgi:AcrR family transcriptional regulator